MKKVYNKKSLCKLVRKYLIPYFLKIDLFCLGHKSCVGHKKCFILFYEKKSYRFGYILTQLLSVLYISNLYRPRYAFLQSYNEDAKSLIHLTIET